MNTYELAHKVTERLYGNDRVKWEIVRFWIALTKKVNVAFGKDRDEIIERISKGHMDEYLKTFIELIEKNCDLEILAEPESTFYNLPMDAFKKVIDNCENLSLTDLLSIVDIGKVLGGNNLMEKIFERLSIIK